MAKIFNSYPYKRIGSSFIRLPTVKNLKRGFLRGKVVPP